MTADTLLPWIGVVVVVLGWAYSAGQLSGQLGRLTVVLDKLADKVGDHEKRISFMEGRTRE